MLNVQDKIHGFTVKKKTYVTDEGATLYEMEYDKCGTRLLFLDREDENKTFAITFKTIPEDSTGVFHIIEHSVLCGSAKYPVKEPFVELLKGSLQTFLNAMTFPDKTMYPISTRNDRDYLNLMSVYMDAVLHPAILSNPNIFRQEGWHYELKDGADGELTRSGVVLNEMRGAFSSADELELYHLTDMLYPDTCYHYESGGKPENIPELTYEQFVSSHAKYYHPSNAEIFLDGSVNLDDALSLLDSYLSEYEPLGVSFEIADQKPITPVERSVEYEIAPNENPENKTRLALGFLAGRFDEQKKNIASEILIGALTSTNESPLKKAVLETGLCEEMATVPYDSVKQNFVVFEFRNVKDGKCDELRERFNSIVSDIVKTGIDRKLLEATLNNLEFKVREKDFGSAPKGIVYAMNILASTLYGGDPTSALSFSECFNELRDALSGNYYEEVLSSVILENEHRAALIMTPSATLGEERTNREKAELAKIKAGFSKEEIDGILKMNEELALWQQTPDTPEKLATIPALSLSDISDKVDIIPEKVTDASGVKTLLHDIETSGIVYLEEYFDVSDLSEEEIFDLKILVSLFSNVKTERHSAIELQNLINSQLGSLSLSVTSMTKRNKDTKIFAVLSASVLDSKKGTLAEIIKEVLYTSSFTDKEVIRNIVRQMKMESEDQFTSRGHIVGFTRAAAGVSAEYAVNEYYSGYEAHLKLKALEKDFDSEFDALICRLDELSGRIFTRERLLISLVGPAKEDFAELLVNSAKSGGKYDPVCKIKPFGVHKEGILIPAQVAYAELCGSLFDIGEEYKSTLGVVKSLLGYGYLWNTVRVQGGAYGVGLLARNSGVMSYYSYRDPSPARSIECYKKSSEFLRAFADSGEDLTKFIIGAIGESDPLATPRLKGVIAATRYIRGVSYEDLVETRRDMLSTDRAELLRVADVLDKIASVGAICVIGGKDKLDACSEIIDTVLEI